MNLTLTTWENGDYENFIEYLKTLTDSKYKAFQSKLVPDINNFIGIRLPVLRKIGKEIGKSNWKSFLLTCKTNYYEEIMLQGIIIGAAKFDYDEFISLTDNFIDLINNWAICDSFCNSLKLAKKYPDYFEHIKIYLSSDNPWATRAGLVIMLSHYIDDVHLEDILKRCDSIHIDDYYVKMAQAWLISAIYVKFPNRCHRYLVNESSLDKWTYNKSIQKIRESLRIDKNLKDELNKLKK